MSGDDSAPGSEVPSSVPRPPGSRILPRQEEGEQRIIEETDQRRAAAGDPGHFTRQSSASASANNSPEPARQATSSEDVDTQPPQSLSFQQHHEDPHPLQTRPTVGTSFPGSECLRAHFF